MNGVCRLCHQPATLKRSHIIPEFLYRGLFRDTNPRQAYRVEPDPQNVIRRTEIMQKGRREHMLCAVCEAHIGKWETYASYVLFHSNRLTFSHLGRLVLAAPIDYSKFKLFQLSILWRAGESTHPDFQGVTLGSHAEILRQMLLSENPGQPADYGCLLSMFRQETEANSPEGLMMTGCLMPFMGMTTCKFMIAGFMWVYFLGTPVEPFPGAFHFLEGGALPLSVIDFDTWFQESFLPEFQL